MLNYDRVVSVQDNQVKLRLGDREFISHTGVAKKPVNGYRIFPESDIEL